MTSRRPGRAPSPPATESVLAGEAGGMIPSEVWLET
jgi:hypothetical protein